MPWNAADTILGSAKSKPDSIQALNWAARERLARQAADELCESSPHAILGLTAIEREARLTTALAKLDRYALDSVRDLRAVVQLCYCVGPDFDRYPAFQRILASRSFSGLAALFRSATDEDWIGAAVCDIVARSRDATDAAAPRESTSLTFSETNSLSLKELTAEHAAAYHQHALHPDVWRLSDMQPLLRLKDVERSICERRVDPDRDDFAIIDARAGFVGALTLYRQGTTARLLYWVGRRFWGKGVATAAVRQHMAMLQRQATIRQVIAEVYAGNTPSLRVLEKCGFVCATAEKKQEARHYRCHFDVAPAVE